MFVFSELFISQKYSLLLISTCIIVLTNILDCKLISEIELSLINVNVSIISDHSDDTNLIIEYICNDGYHMLYEGDFVYECQGNGMWNNSNIPQCVNG